jgi:helicase
LYGVLSAMKLSDIDLGEGVIDILHGQGIDEFYPPQADSIEPTLSGKNVVLAMPTASGKSLVAYLSIIKAVQKGGKALYIVPLRALASEKYDDLKAFESLGLKVALSIGEVALAGEAFCCGGGRDPPDERCEQGSHA